MLQLIVAYKSLPELRTSQILSTKHDFDARACWRRSDVSFQRILQFLILKIQELQALQVHNKLRWLQRYFWVSPEVVIHCPSGSLGVLSPTGMLSLLGLSPVLPDGFVLHVGTERMEGGHQGGACRHGCDPSNRAKLSWEPSSIV